MGPHCETTMTEDSKPDEAVHGSSTLGTMLVIKTDGEGAWPDLKGSPEAFIEAVARLPRGMKSGRSSVGFRIRLTDGTYAIAQLSMRNFQNAARILAAADERDGAPS